MRGMSTAYLEGYQDGRNDALELESVDAMKTAIIEAAEYGLGRNGCPFCGAITDHDVSCISQALLTEGDEKSGRKFSYNDLPEIAEKVDLLKTLEYVHGWMTTWDIYYIPGAHDVAQRVERTLVAAYKRRGGAGMSERERSLCRHCRRVVALAPGTEWRHYTTGSIWCADRPAWGASPGGR